jgi:hypothetical protein
MAIRFRLLPAGVEEAQFKRVPEGWLFTTANPWVFGPRRTYLVNDAQKPALAARVRRSRYIRLILLVPIALLLAAAFIMFPSSLNVRSVQAWLVWGAFVVLITIAISVSDYLTVRPLLRDVPRSSQKIALTDMLGRQGEAMSVRALAIFTLIFVIGTAGQTYQALTSVRLGALVAISAVAFAWLAFVFGRMLVAKLRARYDSSSETSSSIGEPDLTIDRLAAKLDGVERASNFVALGLVGLVVFAAIAGGMLMYLLDRASNAPVQSNISVQSFTLRNAKGDIVASLSAGSDGLPVLILYDGDKNFRAAVGLRNNGTPFLSLSDANGKSRWLATVGEGTQGPRLQLLDVNGTPRWSANVNDVNDKVRGADLRLTNADGGGGWFARVTDRGSELTLSDAKGTVRWSVSVDDGGAHVRTFDAAGKELPAQK